MKEKTSKIQPLEKNKDDGGTPGLACTLSGNHSAQAALRTEQQEQLESNHHENRATGKKGEVDHRRKNSLWERRNGGTPVGYLG
jgi:hypothetical protein